MSIKNDFSSTALTGLNAASYSLSLISNNIANVNSTGYKSVASNFYELLSSGTVGNGVQSGDAQYSFGQGSTIQTGIDTNMMISGDGFFNVQDPGTGQLYYTRAGAFTLSSSGYLVNEQGYRVQGFAQTSSGPASNPSALLINQAAMPPAATTGMTFTGNLDSPANDGAAQSVTFYDARGASHTLTVTFKHDAASTSSSTIWDLSYAVDGTTQTQTPAQTVTFNATTGAMTGGQSQSVNTGITGMSNLTLNMAGMTGYGGSSVSGPVGTANDGNAAGTYSGFSIQKGGVVVEQYSNGQTAQVGTIALTSFFNNGGLQDQGNGNWTAGPNVGTINTNTPGNAGLGSISTGELEGSNVDLSSQVVDMISAQRDFQSDAQVLKVGKTLDQAVLSIDD